MYAGLFLAERLYFDPGKVIFEFDLVQKIDRNQHNHTKEDNLPYLILLISGSVPL